MKNFYLHLYCVLVCLFSTSCQEKTTLTYDYQDFPSHFLTWERVFEQLEPHYWIYVYSESCFYCQSAKQIVLSYLAKNLQPFYLISYSQEVSVHPNVELTIGATEINNLWISGIPSIIVISQHVVCENIVGLEKVTNYVASQSG